MLRSVRFPFSLVLILVAFALALGLAACGDDDDDDDGDQLDDDDDGDDDDDDDDDSDCPDADEDGYRDADCGGEDCDDTDPDVNPGADEVCGDEVDNDCDGTVNDGCTVWETSTIDTTEFEEGMFGSYSMGTGLGYVDGDPVVAYSVYPDEELRVAWGDASGSSWTTEVIDDSRRTGARPRLAVDPTNGNVAIVYFQTGLLGIVKGGFLAYGTAGDWSIEEFSQTTGAGGDPDIEFDSTGTAHVVYDGDDGDFTYATWTAAGGWTRVGVDYADGYLENYDLALDSSSNPFVTGQGRVQVAEEVYWDLHVVAWPTDEGWGAGYIIDPNVYHPAAEGTAVTVDGDENPVFFTTNDGSEDLISIVWNGSWDMIPVEEEFSVGRFVSADTAPDGTVGCAYYHTSLGSLHYATFNGTDWDIEEADTSTNAGRFTSLAYNDDGVPGIAYMDIAGKAV